MRLQRRNRTRFDPRAAAFVPDQLPRFLNKGLNGSAQSVGDDLFLTGTGEATYILTDREVIVAVEVINAPAILTIQDGFAPFTVISTQTLAVGQHIITATAISSRTVVSFKAESQPTVVRDFKAVEGELLNIITDPRDGYAVSAVTDPRAGYEGAIITYPEGYNP